MMTKFRNLIAGCLSVLIFAGVSAPAANAQYYEGKTIELIVGAGPSSGVTILARILAKELSNSIEGKPDVIVRNLPGAGGAKAQNFVFEKAPKNGTTLYYGFWNGLAQVVGAPGHRFQYEEFEPLGGLKLAGVLAWGRQDALPEGSTDLADLGKEEPFRFGAVGLNAGRDLMAVLGLEALGIDYRFIGGYAGGGAVRQAVASGELQGAADAIHIYLPLISELMGGQQMGVFHIPLIDQDGEVSSNPILAEYAPSFNELYERIHGAKPSGIEWEAFKHSIVLTQSMQHLLVGPPGLDEDAAAALEAGLRKAVESDSFAEAMKKQVIFVPDYVDRETARTVLEGPSRTPEELRKYYADLIASHTQ